MKKQILAQIEQVFFIMINIVFSASPIVALAFLVVSMLATSNMINSSISVRHDEEYYIELFCFLMWSIYMFFKLFLFPILFALPRNFPYINLFFNRFKIEHSFRLKILGLATLFDVFLYFVCVAGMVLFGFENAKDISSAVLLVLFFWIIFGGGVLTSYFAFYLNFKVLHKLKCQKSKT